MSRLFLHRLLVALGTAAFLASSMSVARADDHTTEVATFAGGCFWCIEEGFDKLDGVQATISGFMGGNEPNPSYREVASGQTTHTEAVQVTYNPNVVSYAALVEAFWRMMDPTDADGQFVDRGAHYRPEVFVHNEQQRQIAEESKSRLAASGRFDDPIVVPITDASEFYEADEYHQNYYQKNPIRYRFYARNSGRYQFIDQVWGDDATIEPSNYRNEDYL